MVFEKTIGRSNGENYMITMGSESNIDNTYDTYIRQAKEVMKQHEREINGTKMYDIDYDAIIKNPEVVMPNKGEVKKKASRVANIVTYLNTNEEMYEMVATIFGDGLVDELLKANVKEEYITKVESAIKRLKDLEQKETKGNKSYADELLKKNNLPYKTASATLAKKRTKPRINFNPTQYSFVHSRDNSSYKYVY